MDWVYVKAVISHVTVFEDGASEEVRKGKPGHKGGIWSNRIGVFLETSQRSLSLYAM